jgi:hypothetical protein
VLILVGLVKLMAPPAMLTLVKSMKPVEINPAVGLISTVGLKAGLYSPLIPKMLPVTTLLGPVIVTSLPDEVAPV